MAEQKAVTPQRSYAPLLIVLVLMGVVVGVLIKQAHYPAERFQQLDPSVLLAVADSAEPSHPPLLEQWTPDGFAPMAAPESYDLETLFEKINGKADLYLNNGFVSLACQRFSLADNPDLWFEIYAYDMGSAAGAIAVYSQQRRPDAQELAGALFGYETGDAVFFAQGSYYVEVRAGAADDELNAAMIAWSGNAIQQIPPDESLRQTLAWFPEEKLQAGSVRYYHADAFGVTVLDGLWAANYELSALPITVFIKACADATEAETVLRGFRDELLSQGANDMEAAMPESGHALDFYGMIELGATVEHVVVGIHQGTELDSAVTLLATVRQRISETLAQEAP